MAEQQATLRMLHVERDARYRMRIGETVRAFGHSIVDVDDTIRARTLLRAHAFDVVVVDLSPPIDDGQRFLADLLRLQLPWIIVTSTLPDDGERILALESGADEFLQKPFSGRALIAHLHAYQRRANGHGLGTSRASVALCGPWNVDFERHRAATEHATVGLTRGEAAVLRVLLEHPRVTLSRARLLSAMHKDDARAFDRTVDVLVSRLRKKFDVDPGKQLRIETVRGEGYCLSAAVTWQHAGA